MNDTEPVFNRGVVRPVECLRGGWELIKQDYWLFFGISVVGMLIASFVPLYIAFGPAMCGIYFCLLRRQRGQIVKFDHLTRGIDYFLQSLIATLLMLVPFMVIVAPAYLIYLVLIFAQVGQQPKGAPPDPAFFWTMFVGAGVVGLLAFVVWIIVSALFMFTYPLIVERRMSGVQAAKTSVRAAWANLGGVLGFGLLSALLNAAGAFACGIGGLFILPVHMAATLVAYRAVFPVLGKLAKASEPIAIDPEIGPTAVPGTTGN